MDTALSWIKAYVPGLEVSAHDYTEAMTLTGTKVEGYRERFVPLKSTQMQIS